MPLPSLEILERSPERPFYRCFIARELGKFVATTRAETEEDEIDVSGLFSLNVVPSGTGAHEEAAFDTVSAAETPGVQGDALGELMLHRSLRSERGDKLGIEALELLALFVEQDDALSGQTML